MKDKCHACGQIIVPKKDRGSDIPCSEFHVRCYRCHWPVAQVHMGPEGLCDMCINSARQTERAQAIVAHKKKPQLLQVVQQEENEKAN